MSEHVIADVLKQENKDAILLLQSGKYEEALVFFRHSYEIEKSLKLTKHAYETKINIANTLFLMKQYKEAYEELEEALEYIDAKRDSSNYYATKTFMGRMLLLQGCYEELAILCKEIMSLCKDDSVKGTAYLFQYEIEKHNQENRKSIDALNKAVNCFERKRDYQNLKLALTVRADYYAKNRRADLAAVDRLRCEELNQK